MAVVLVLALAAEFCRACNGTGRRRLITAGPTVHENAPCPDCGGIGDVPADYLIEIGTLAEMDHVLENLWPK